MAWESKSPTYQGASGFFRILLILFFNVRFHFRTSKEEYLKNTPFLFYSNHHSFGLDAVIYSVGLYPTPVHVIAKATLFETPVISFIVKELGGIPIHRNNDQTGSRQQNIELLNGYASNLEIGKNLGIFPEGTCDNHLRLKRFRSGIGRIANRVVETKGRIDLKSAFLFYMDRVNLFSEIRVLYLDDLVLKEQQTDQGFVKSLEQSVRNVQLECYRPLKKFLNGIEVQVDEEKLIQIHERRSVITNYLMYLAEPISFKEKLLGILATILYPFVIFIAPLGLVVKKLAKVFSLDRSELSTYKLGLTMILTPVYILTMSLVIHPKLLVPLSLVAFVSLTFTAARRKFLAKTIYTLNSKLLNQIISHWIVKESK